jgi:hypothetical protein
LLVAVYFLPSFLVVAIGKGQLQNRHPKARQRLTMVTNQGRSVSSQGGRVTEEPI